MAGKVYTLEEVGDDNVHTFLDTFGARELSDISGDEEEKAPARTPPTGVPAAARDTSYVLNRKLSLAGVGPALTNRSNQTRVVRWQDTRGQSSSTPEGVAFTATTDRTATQRSLPPTPAQQALSPGTNSDLQSSFRPLETPPSPPPLGASTASMTAASSRPPPPPTGIRPLTYESHPLAGKLRLAGKQVESHRGRLLREKGKWRKKWALEWVILQNNVLITCTKEEPFLVKLCVPLKNIQSIELASNAEGRIIEVKYVAAGKKGKERFDLLRFKAHGKGEAEDWMDVLRAFRKIAIRASTELVQEVVDKDRADAALMELHNAMRSSGLLQMCTRLSGCVRSYRQDCLRYGWWALQQNVLQQRLEHDHSLFRRDLQIAAHEVQQAKHAGAVGEARARRLLRVGTFLARVSSLMDQQRLLALLQWRRNAQTLAVHRLATGMDAVLTNAIVASHQSAARQQLSFSHHRLAAALEAPFRKTLSYALLTLQAFAGNQAALRLARKRALLQLVIQMRLSERCIKAQVLSRWKATADKQSRMASAMRQAVAGQKREMASFALRRWSARGHERNRRDTLAVRLLELIVQRRKKMDKYACFKKLSHYAVNQIMLEASQIAANMDWVNQEICASQQTVPQERACFRLERLIDNIGRARTHAVFHHLHCNMLRKRVLSRHVAVASRLLNRLVRQRQQQSFRKLRTHGLRESKTLSERSLATAQLGAVLRNIRLRQIGRAFDTLATSSDRYYYRVAQKRMPSFSRMSLSQFHQQGVILSPEGGRNTSMSSDMFRKSSPPPQSWPPLTSERDFSPPPEQPHSSPFGAAFANLDSSPLEFQSIRLPTLSREFSSGERRQVRHSPTDTTEVDLASTVNRSSTISDVTAVKAPNVTAALVTPPKSASATASQTPLPSIFTSAVPTPAVSAAPGPPPAAAVSSDPLENVQMPSSTSQAPISEKASADPILSKIVRFSVSPLATCRPSSNVLPVGVATEVLPKVTTTGLPQSTDLPGSNDSSAPLVTQRRHSNPSALRSASIDSTDSRFESPFKSAPNQSLAESFPPQLSDDPDCTAYESVTIPPPLQTPQAEEAPTQRLSVEPSLLPLQGLSPPSSGLLTRLTSPGLPSTSVKAVGAPPTKEPIYKLAKSLPHAMQLKRPRRITQIRPQSRADRAIVERMVRHIPTLLAEEAADRGGFESVSGLLSRTFSSDCFRSGGGASSNTSYADSLLQFDTLPSSTAQHSGSPQLAYCKSNTSKRTNSSNASYLQWYAKQRPPAERWNIHSLSVTNKKHAPFTRKYVDSTDFLPTLLNRRHLLFNEWSPDSYYQVLSSDYRAFSVLSSSAGTTDVPGHGSESLNWTEDDSVMRLVCDDDATMPTADYLDLLLQQQTKQQSHY